MDACRDIKLFPMVFSKTQPSLALHAGCGLASSSYRHRHLPGGAWRRALCMQMPYPAVGVPMLASGTFDHMNTLPVNKLAIARLPFRPLQCSGVLRKGAVPVAHKLFRSCSQRTTTLAAQAGRRSIMAEVELEGFSQALEGLKSGTYILFKGEVLPFRQPAGCSWVPCLSSRPPGRPLLLSDGA
jgi:hypothetical protein